MILRAQRHAVRALDGSGHRGLHQGVQAVKAAKAGHLRLLCLRDAVVPRLKSAAWAGGAQGWWSGGGCCGAARQKRSWAFTPCDEHSAVAAYRLAACGPLQCAQNHACCQLGSGCHRQDSCAHRSDGFRACTEMGRMAPQRATPCDPWLPSPAKELPATRVRWKPHTIDCMDRRQGLWRRCGGVGLLGAPAAAGLHRSIMRIHPCRADRWNGKEGPPAATLGETLPLRGNQTGASRRTSDNGTPQGCSREIAGGLAARSIRCEDTALGGEPPGQQAKQTRATAHAGATMMCGTGPDRQD